MLDVLSRYCKKLLRCMASPRLSILIKAHNNVDSIGGIAADAVE
jgi:hypothetical protein